MARWHRPVVREVFVGSLRAGAILTVRVDALPNTIQKLFDDFSFDDIVELQQRSSHMVEIGMLGIEKTPLYLRALGYSPRRRQVFSHGCKFVRWSYGW